MLYKELQVNYLGNKSSKKLFKSPQHSLGIKVEKILGIPKNWKLCDKA